MTFFSDTQATVTPVYPNLLGIDWATSVLVTLTLATALFAVAAIVLVLGGVFAFINFRTIARKQARQTASVTAKATAEAAANKYLQENLSDILHEYVTMMGGGASGGEANRIAQEQ